MRLPFTAVLILASVTSTAAEPTDRKENVAAIVAKVKRIDREGKNGEAAAEAARRLSELSVDAIPRILELSHDANPLATNLLRAAVERIADRSESGFPVAALETVVKDVRHGAKPRRLAYEIALKADPAIAERLIPHLLHDPSPELRRDAVSYHVAKAERLKESGTADEAKAEYEKALTGAIDDDQVRNIVEALKGYGVEIDLQKHFGFVTNWQVIGPFDNRDMKGFDAVYPPEENVDFDAVYAGQLGDVSWKPITTDDPYGVIDVAKQIENYKGSAMYLAAEFDAETGRDAEIRLGTPNSWKLWINGEFLFGREEYHRGEELDQYRVTATLKPGRNLILLKLLQNEQTDDWAQSYKFRLRVSDKTGQAILPTTSDVSE